MVRDGLALCAACGAELVVAAPSDAVYSQKNGERPPGCSRTKFLAAWRRARDVGDEGVWAEGRARLMRASTWARVSRTAVEPARYVPAPFTIGGLELVDLVGEHPPLRRLKAEELARRIDEAVGGAIQAISVTHEGLIKDLAASPRRRSRPRRGPATEG